MANVEENSLFLIPQQNHKVIFLGIQPTNFVTWTFFRDGQVVIVIIHNVLVKAENILRVNGYSYIFKPPCQRK